MIRAHSKVLKSSWYEYACQGPAFGFETLRTEAAARKYLADNNLAHFFDAAAACVAVQDDDSDED